MNFLRLTPILVGTALLLPACSFTEDSLWPSLAGEEPASQSAEQAQSGSAPSQPAQPAAGPSAATAGGPPPINTTDFTPPGVTPGQSTGTFVGKKVEEMRSELQKLQASVRDHNGRLQEVRARMIADAQRYHGTVGGINSRLQVGTTPGNPILVQQFNGAQADLDRLANDIATMNMLATEVTADSTLSAFLSESVRNAFSVSGAVDEDHAQLTVLQDEVDQTVILIDRLLKEVAEDVRRQTAYVATERSNLNLLATGIKSGEIYGTSLVNQALVSAAGSSLGSIGTKPMDTSGRRPLVVIRFDKPNIQYQQALYNAVSKVLERRPDAVFDLVAVASNSGGPARVALNSNKARRYSEDVLRSLVEMGLPPGRVALSGKTSPQAKATEVHLYLR